MKAVRISNYGGIDELNYENVPQPTPEEGEVLIRVLYTSVNPFDSALRAGYVSQFFNHELPLVLGVDVSGIIEEVGTGVE